MRNYMIWSFEHDAWWKPMSLGYTKDPRQAGQYDPDKALDIVHRSNRGYSRRPTVVNECMIPAVCVLPELADVEKTEE